MKENENTKQKENEMEKVNDMATQTEWAKIEAKNREDAEIRRINADFKATKAQRAQAHKDAEYARMIEQGFTSREITAARRAEWNAFIRAHNVRGVRAYNALMEEAIEKFGYSFRVLKNAIAHYGL